MLDLLILFIHDYFPPRRTSMDRRIPLEQLYFTHLLWEFSKLDQTSTQKISSYSIFPKDQLLIDAISLRAIPIAVAIILVYNSSVDQNRKLFNRIIPTIFTEN